MPTSNERLPDLPDMQAAGMGLTEALAFWGKMVNTPGHPPSYWWDAVRAYRPCFHPAAAGRALH
jgi:hypothetical protein